MPLFCELCHVTVPSDVVMRDHKQGKHHKAMEQANTYRTELAERSIFVRGFRPSATSEEIASCFASAGTVQKVILDTEKAHFAFVEFATKAEAQQALDGGPWHIGGRKVVVKPRDVKPVVNKKPTRLVTSQTQANAAGDEVKEITRLQFDFEIVCKKLATVHDIVKQLQLLPDLVGLDDNDTRQRSTISSELQHIFEPYFPGCCVHMFGSSANGFGVRGCDMDLFLDLNLDAATDEQYKQVPAYPHLPYTADIPSVKFDNSRIVLSSLLSVSPSDRLRLVARILTSSRSNFTDILTIGTARVPVIKMKHRLSGMPCDLSISSSLSLRNTEFLQCLAAIPVVRELLYAVRVWAKVREIAGNVQTGPRLTNYALLLLVVLFLSCDQSRDGRQVLPSVEQLAQRSVLKTTIDGWDCSFDPSHVRLQDCDDGDNTQHVVSTVTLLRGFFDFYASVDWKTSVLCVRTATLENVATFQENSGGTLPNFKVMPMCIQDPFELDHNVAANVNERTIDKIAAEFQRAQAISSREDFEHDVRGFLALVSDDNVGIVETPLSTAHAAGKETNSVDNLSTGSSILSFILTTDVKRLPASVRQLCCSTSCLGRKWRHDACHLVFRCLKDLLRVRCTLCNAANLDLLDVDKCTAYSSTGHCSTTNPLENDLKTNAGNGCGGKCVVCGAVLAAKRRKVNRDVKKTGTANNKSDSVSTAAAVEGGDLSRKRSIDCVENNVVDDEMPAELSSKRLCGDVNRVDRDSDSSDEGDSYESDDTSDSDDGGEIREIAHSRNDIESSWQNFVATSAIANVTKEEDNLDFEVKSTSCVFALSHRSRPLTVRCETIERLWERRKMVAKELRGLRQHSVSSTYDLELAVTRQLLSQQQLVAANSLSQRTPIEFNVTISSTVVSQVADVNSQERSTAHLQLDLAALTLRHECSAFFLFLKAFLTRLIGDCLYSAD